MANCPKCGAAMDMRKEAREVEGPAITGGYFGERPEEYAVTPSGHTLGITNVSIFTCPRCGYSKEE